MQAPRSGLLTFAPSSGKVKNLTTFGYFHFTASYKIKTDMPVGILTLYLHIPGCRSLKEKRSQIRPVIARLHKEFNVSVAEIDLLDSWDQSVIACALIANDKNHIQRSLQKIIGFTENSWKNMYVADQQIELF